MLPRDQFGRRVYSETENNNNKNQTSNRIKQNADLVRNAKQKAHSIVLELLIKSVSDQYFKDNIKYITPEHFDDVVIERAITGLCGYPLCQSMLEQKKYDKQKYTIVSNKIYDVTHRRNFCSNQCYQASELVLDQIPTTPLYLRASDKEIQQFNLTLPDLSTLKGRIGKFVSVTETIIETDKDPTDEEKRQRKVEIDPKLDLDDKDNPLTSSCEELRSDDGMQSSASSDTSEGSHITADTLSIDIENRLGLNSTGSCKKQSYPRHRNDEKFNSRKWKKQSSENEIKNLPPKSPYDEIYHLEHTLREWMTFESLRAILGDVYVRGMLEQFGETWEDYDTTAGMRLGVESKSKYIALSKKLQTQEIKEKILDAQQENLEQIIDNPSVNTEPRALQDYEQLKKNIETSSLRVEAYYAGREADVTNYENLETIPEEENAELQEPNESKKIKKKRQTKQPPNYDHVTLPLIDNYSQVAWRQQIVNERLSQGLSSFANDLSLNEKEIRRLTTSLVTTFDLSSHNICLTIRQWKFVTLILLKMLSVRYSEVMEAFAQGGPGCEIVTTFLREKNLDPDYLDRLLAYLTEISYILSKYHQSSITDLSGTQGQSTSADLNGKHPHDVTMDLDGGARPTEDFVDRTAAREENLHDQTNGGSTLVDHDLSEDVSSVHDPLGRRAASMKSYPDMEDAAAPMERAINTIINEGEMEVSIKQNTDKDSKNSEKKASTNYEELD